jgi:hypothetical protein
LGWLGGVRGYFDGVGGWAAFPVWATILISMDVLVIYALAAHGRELRPAG